MKVLCTSLPPELESIASQPRASKPYLMSPSEAKFIAYVITRYGSNYKVGRAVRGYAWVVCSTCMYWGGDEVDDDVYWCW